MKFVAQDRGSISWELRYSVAVVGRYLPAVTIRGVLDSTPLEEMVEECRQLADERKQGVAQMAVFVFGENAEVISSAERLRLPVFREQEALQTWSQEVFRAVWPQGRLEAWREAAGYTSEEIK